MKAKWYMLAYKPEILKDLHVSCHTQPSVSAALTLCCLQLPSVSADALWLADQQHHPNNIKKIIMHIMHNNFLLFVLLSTKTHNTQHR